VFWRGRAEVSDLQALMARFLGAARAELLLRGHARAIGAPAADSIAADARLVHFVETQLAGVIGSASARVMVASVVEEDALDMDDVLRILDEASQLRAYSQALEQATAELRAANERLESLDRLKDDFMSSVTHELRTPLTSIRALAELMLDDPEMPEAQRQQFLGIVVAETERLSRLVNQVLDMAKIESGHAEWHNSDVDLAALLRQAAQTVQEMVRERGATLALHLPDASDAPLPLLRADADRLMQVLMNLLSNAAKFVPSEGGRIELRLIPDKDGATVEVQDNGPGVPADQRELVFEKFRQGGDGISRPQGTGLGLPISRQIVEHFGGRMELRPGVGRGACFAFTLPWHHTATEPIARRASAAGSEETIDERQGPDR
jgi:signal transduction histidine kinase